MITFDAQDQGWHKLDTEHDLEWYFPYTDDMGQMIQGPVNKPERYPVAFKPVVTIPAESWGVMAIAALIYDFTDDGNTARWQSSDMSC